MEGSQFREPDLCFMDSNSHHPADFDVLLTCLRLNLSEPAPCTSEAPSRLSVKLCFGNGELVKTDRVTPSADGLAVRDYIPSAFVIFKSCR